MLTIQTLRRSRGLTLVDIAMLSGIPARTLGAIECGTHRLDHRTRDQLARIFAVAPESLVAAPRPALEDALRRKMLAEARAAAPMVGAALASAVLLAPAVASLASTPPAPPPPVAPQPTPVAQAAPAQAVARVAPPPAPAVESARLAPPPTAAPLTMPTAEVAAPAAPVVVAEAPAPPPAAPATDEPYGCPLATSGRIVITQGYGVGTHAPAEIWGGVDLAVVPAGDGPGATATTQGTLVFTPIAGVAYVALDTWPGGNYVRIVNSDTGWSTAYAHLDQVFVTGGQRLEPGTVIGTVGSTGMSTGPHLHYEVWRRGVNQDPTPFLRCG